jgi:hypothetical protein
MTLLLHPNATCRRCAAAWLSFPINGVLSRAVLVQDLPARSVELLSAAPAANMSKKSQQTLELEEETRRMESRLRALQQQRDHLLTKIE